MTRKVVFRTARGSRAQPLIETLDRRLLLAAAPTSTVIYAVQATASAADSVRTFAGSVTLPLAGGSSAFDSGGAHISVSVAKSVVTVSGTGFAQEEGFTITGTAGGSGPLVLSADGDTYGGSGPIAGTARSVDNEDGTVYQLGVTGSFSVQGVIHEAPHITSAGAATFHIGSPSQLTITTTGHPKPTLSETAILPEGITFTDNGNGTATLAGTPAATNSAGNYNLIFTANNGVSPDANQFFVLTLDNGPVIDMTQPPAFTSADKVTLQAGVAATFAITAIGNPLPHFSLVGTLPADLSFQDNLNGTASLFGAPASGTGGVYKLVVVADDGLGHTRRQTITLTINAPPATVHDLSPQVQLPPRAVIPGARKNPVSFHFTNPSLRSFKARVPLQLFASPTADYDAATAVPLLDSRLKLSVHGSASRDVTANFSSPASIATGDYYIVAVLDSTNVIVSPGTVGFVAPVIDLSTTIAPLPPAGAAKVTVTVSVTNSGNVATAGVRDIALVASTDTVYDAGVDLQLAHRADRKAIKPGTTRFYKFKVLASDVRYLVATTTFSGVPADSTPANNTAFLVTPFLSTGGAIVGRFFRDQDHDHLPGAAESGLANWQVYVDSNNDGVISDGEPSTFSDANGYYALSNLAPGDYRIREVRMTGWNRTFPEGPWPLFGYHDVTITAIGEVVVGQDFGNYLGT